MNRDEIMRWRRGERKRLIGERLATPVEIRRRHDNKIIASLEEVLPEVQGLTISAYWPFRGEPDLRSFMSVVANRGGKCALPVVVECMPLVFRPWRPGQPLARGVWNIPVPVTTAEVVPDVVIAPYSPTAN
jgi:5,10-methenyltetrahydrofolate synthetase